MTDEVRRRVRGKAVKPNMVYVSLRIEKEVFEFFNIYPNRSAKIREVLINHIIEEGYGSQILGYETKQEPD